MNEKSFKEVESRIYRYYKNIKKIERLEYKCLVLEKAKEQLKKDIQNVNITIDPFVNLGVSYQERVQTSINGTSYAEKETIKENDKLIKELKDTKKQILKIHSKIRDIKKVNAEIEHIINKLTSENKIIAELKYKEQLSLKEIGEKLFISKSTVKRKREKIVLDIYKEL